MWPNYEKIFMVYGNILNIYVSSKSFSFTQKNHSRPMFAMQLSGSSPFAPIALRTIIFSLIKRTITYFDVHFFYIPNYLHENQPIKQTSSDFLGNW